jgi:GT2 family glycosyltransferase
MLQISVVIPTYNSWETLKDCIKSIYDQTAKPVEVIVVDNASPDNTGNNVKKYFSQVKLIQMNKNTGVTGGRNQGIEVVSKNSDHIFFFDHDMVADKKMLEELVKVAKVDERIGIVTPRIYYWQDKKRIWSAGTGINLWTGQVVFRGGEDRGQFEKVEEVQVAPAAMLVKKAVIEKIAGFDERYFATFEDTNFCFRAKKAGFKTYYAPKAIAYHKLSTDPKDEADRLLARAYWIGRNRVLFMKEFGKNFFVFLAFLSIFSFYYLFLAIKYRRLPDWFRFIYGTFYGILK